MPKKPLSKKDTKLKTRTMPPVMDFAQMKLDFFGSQHATVSEFLRAINVKLSTRVQEKTV